MYTPFRILAFILLSGLFFPVHAENNSDSDESDETESSGITIDFSAGMPYYFGDFNPLWGQPGMFEELEIGTGEQSNDYGLSASVSFPLFSSLSFRLRTQMAAFQFSEIQSGAYFRNVVYDVSGQLKLHLLERKLGTYIYAGPGYHNHFDTEIFPTEDLAASEPIDGRIHRLSLQGGAGIEFYIIPRIAVFTEVDWMLTGSDRLDGFNGNVDQTEHEERDSEKPYFQRDQFITGRAGVRFSFFDPPRDKPERSYDNPVTSVAPDITRIPPEMAEELPDVAIPDDWPPHYLEYNIYPALTGVTIAIGYARDLVELQRQREVAQRIADEIADEPDQYEILSAPEMFGYSLHIGTFASRGEARQIMTRITQYYSGAEIREH